MRVESVVMQRQGSRAVVFVLQSGAFGFALNQMMVRLGLLPAPVGGWNTASVLPE